ncbi:MAG TPA: hypothetical protein VIT92_06860 [Burkholderiaceae bacterium]
MTLFPAVVQTAPLENLRRGKNDTAMMQCKKRAGKMKKAYKISQVRFVAGSGS